MQGGFRFGLCLVLSGSLAFAAIPRQPLVPEIEKADCCAALKAKSATPDCDHHQPKPAPDKQCCVFCASCLAGVLTPGTAFVYPTIGDETFAAYVSSEQSRSQRPPVPPPRT